LAYHTLGEISRALYWLVVSLNVPLLLLARWRMRAATVGILVLALLVVPYQAALGARLWRVQREAAAIVHHAYQIKLATGAFPDDLSGYVYRDTKAARFITHYGLSEELGGFGLSYRVGTVNTSHTYSPRYGWGYYPD
jgi:hypothetical protein